MSSSWSPPEAVLIVAPEGRIRSANAAAERLLGYGRGELAGLDADQVLDGERSVGWSRRKGLSNTASIVFVHHGREEFMPPPRRPQPAPVAAEMDAESLGLLENEILLVNGLAEVALANLPPDDPAREDVERLTRAAARAAILCRQAMPPVKTASLRTLRLDLFVDNIERRLRSFVEPAVEVTIQTRPAAGSVSANAELLEQAVLSLVLHALPSVPGPCQIRLATAPGGRLEASVQPRDGHGPAWRCVLGERKLPRAAAWLASQGAMLEEEVAEGGVGHRFRIHLAPVPTC